MGSTGRRRAVGKLTILLPEDLIISSNLTCASVPRRFSSPSRTALGTDENMPIWGERFDDIANEISGSSSPGYIEGSESVRKWKHCDTIGVLRPDAITKRDGDEASELDHHRD
jgi:hypothetical protein